MTNEAASPAIMRSMLGQVRGLGSAKSGTAHWWAQRATALALIPLSLWFVFSVIRLAGLPRPAMLHWAANPLNATLLVALVLAMFHHLQLGLQVVIEDYVHAERSRLLSLLLVRAAIYMLGLAALVAALKLAFTG
jgi:succinate dehydrogenase / fumarate reductase membrane anchor subunit